MSKIYAYELLEEKIRLLRKEGRDKEVLILLKVFSEAQDLVEEVVPLPGDKELSCMALTLKIEIREKLLIDLMKPFFNFNNLDKKNNINSNKFKLILNADRLIFNRSFFT